MRNTFKKILYLLVAVATVCGCNGNAKSPLSAFPKQFPGVSAPSMITDMEEAMTYMSLHFWDRYLDSAALWCPFDDTTRLGGVSVDNVKEAYVEYVKILWSVPVKDALAAQVRMMDKMEAAAQRDTSFIRIFDEFYSLSDAVLYGVNSDFRNEEFHIPILKKMVDTPLQTPMTEQVLRDKYSEELAECMKNRIGEAASDFIFSTANGRLGSLYEVRGDIILLFFSNPGCKACLEIINSLKSSEVISGKIASGKLAVLNIYIDEDLTEWFKYMPVYPTEWVNAYQPDFRVRQERIYDVRAIPSLYILDKDKRVLFKDVNPEFALNFLENQSD